MELQELRLPSSDTADPELKLSKAALDVAYQGLAFWRETDRAAFPLEQDSSEISLEAANGVAHGARRQAEVLRG